MSMSKRCRRKRIARSSVTIRSRFAIGITAPTERASKRAFTYTYAAYLSRKGHVAFGRYALETNDSAYDSCPIGPNR